MSDTLIIVIAITCASLVVTIHTYSILDCLSKILDALREINETCKTEDKHGDSHK